MLLRTFDERPYLCPRCCVTGDPEKSRSRSVDEESILNTGEKNMKTRFANRDAKRQLNVQPQSMLCFVDFGVLEFQPDMQKPRTGLPIEPRWPITAKPAGPRE